MKKKIPAKYRQSSYLYIMYLMNKCIVRNYVAINQLFVRQIKARPLSRVYAGGQKTSLPSIQPMRWLSKGQEAAGGQMDIWDSLEKCHCKKANMRSVVTWRLDETATKTCTVTT